MNSFGVHGSRATGIWNSVKNIASDKWVIGGSAIGLGIGIYESMKPNVYGSSTELGAIGIGTGAVTGAGLKALWNTPDGIPFFGRGAL